MNNNHHGSNINISLSDDSQYVGVQNIEDPQIIAAIMESIKDAKKDGDNSNTVEIEIVGEAEYETVDIGKLDLEYGLQTRIENIVNEYDFSSDVQSVDNSNQTGDVSSSKTDNKNLKGKRKGQHISSSGPQRGKGKSYSEDYIVDEFDSEESFEDDDTDYKPPKRNRSVVPKHKVRGNQLDFAYRCNYCQFSTDVLGVFKVHLNAKHNHSSPSYLDMAEGALMKIKPGPAGVDDECILKEIIYEHFDAISENKESAFKLLNQSLTGGVQLGRLQLSGRGRTKKYKIVSREKRKLVYQRWTECSTSVEMHSDGGLRKKASCLNVRRMPISKKNVGTVKTSPKPRLRPQTGKQQIPFTISILPNLFCISQNFIPQSSSNEDQDYEEYSKPGPYCTDCELHFWYESELDKHILNVHVKGSFDQEILKTSSAFTEELETMDSFTLPNCKELETSEIEKCIVDADVGKSVEFELVKDYTDN